MHARSIILFVCWLLPALSLAQYTPGVVEYGTNGYVEYYPGDLPIIISAPHGGDLEPASIPDRSCSGCVTVKDTWTMEVTLELDSAIQAVFGGHAHIIVNRLHRKKLDANREIGQAALGDTAAERAWHEYHDYLQEAKNYCVNNFGSAIYIDMHAHGHPIQRIELGYLLTKTELQNNDSYLNTNNFQDSSAVKHLKNVLNPLEAFSEILRGNDCMGEFLHDRGYPSVPSAADPAPLSADPYFNGGYNTARHGSRDSSAINGIQFELNYTGIRNTNANRHAFARALACVLRSYLDRWYFDLDLWDPGNIVTNTANEGPGSLRSALLGASDGDTITFHPSLMGDTIHLSTELQICSDITIAGLGASNLFISGSNTTRIMRVMFNSHLNLSDLTLMHGSCPTGEDGGAMRIEGSMLMTHCQVRNNYADDDGGAISVSGVSASAVLDSCIISQNACGDDGGAFRIWEGSLTVKHSTVTNNYSPSYGGSISSNGSITVIGSTFSHNVANGEGGAIRLFSTASLTASNSTFAHNSAGLNGGGISSATPAQLDFCTIAYNDATGNGGGMFMEDTNATVSNCVIALNTANSGQDVSAANVAFISNGYNLVGDTTGSSWIAASGDQLGEFSTPLDPLLGTLSNLGGNAETIPLQTNSLAIDAAHPTLILSADQRGFNRPSGARADIGAFELCQTTYRTDSLMTCDSLTWVDGITYYQSVSGVTYTLQNINGCDSIITLELEVPTIDTSVSNLGNALTANSTSGTYQWLHCDSLLLPIAGATAQTFSPAQNGLYAVAITSQGCVDTSQCALVSTIGISELNHPHLMAVHPNPSDGQIQITFEEAPANLQIILYNALGAQVKSQASIGRKTLSYTLPEAKGIYFLEVRIAQHATQVVRILRL